MLGSDEIQADVACRGVVRYFENAVCDENVFTKGFYAGNVRTPDFKRGSVYLGPIGGTLKQATLEPLFKPDTNGTIRKYAGVNAYVLRASVSAERIKGCVNRCDAA